MKGLNYTLAFIGGATVGAALGLLYAPDKGENTRRRISQKSREVCDTLGDALRRRGIHLSKEEINDLVADIKEEVVLGEDA